MGVDKYYHLGPYARCLYKVVQTTEIRIACPTKECPEAPRSWPETYPARFCHLCGARLVITHHARYLPNVTPEELRAKLVDRLAVQRLKAVEPPVDLWYGNLTVRLARSERERRTAVGDVEDGFARVLTIDISDELVHFADMYKNELESLREAYGQTHVEVEWGLISYYA